MSLSQNIRYFRLKKNFTQEMLAARIGVSAQAISKWENSETYPDGSLLLPLARELDVSLDTLFDNSSVSMEDLSRKILALLANADEKERFQLIRAIGWEAERGLFHAQAPFFDPADDYDPNALKHQHYASYILSDAGFTLISNGKEPFFSVFPEPEEGFGHFLTDQSEWRFIFSTLADPDTWNALIVLYRHADRYMFEDTVLAHAAGIPAEHLDTVLQNLQRLRVIEKKTLALNGENRTVYLSHPSPALLALLLVARQINYRGAYSYMIDGRNVPFLRT